MILIIQLKTGFSNNYDMPIKKLNQIIIIQKLNQF